MSSRWRAASNLPVVSPPISANLRQSPPISSSVRARPWSAVLLQPLSASSRVAQVRLAGRLPVVTFAAGGLATPADVALLMELGVDGVFVGSGIFKGENPAARARAMVAACTHYRDPATVAKVSEGLGKAMVGLLEHESGPEVAAKLALKGRIGVDPAVGA